MLFALIAGGLAPNVAAIGPDKSDVVMEFDFSSSITSDKTNRARFAAAIDQIANRVTETAADLVQGDTTVSLVQFATRAANVPGCVDLSLLQSPITVSQFAKCLHTVANQYKSGGNPALKTAIGVNTDYVAALKKAGEHLPADAVRPTVIFFTDGKHDVAGADRPFAAVITEKNALVDGRASIAILPVGMGLASKDRPALQKNLEQLQVIRGIPDCLASGATVEWPTVVFNSPAQAGTAVGQALADATCTFTPAPTPTPPPAPKPPVVANVRLTPGDGTIDLIWTPAPPNAKAPVVDFDARCRAGDSGVWIESKEGTSLVPRATIDGLTNGTTYECEVASIGKDGTPGIFTQALDTATPIGKPAIPPVPTVTAGNGQLEIVIPTQATNEQYTIECSADGGQTFPATGQAAGQNAATTIAVTNGAQYQCRATAHNAVGDSEPSALSAAAFPCNGFLQCTPSMLPIIGGGIGALVLGILIAGFFLYRDRQRGHVVAVVDVLHTANIGHGSFLGIAFVHSPETRKVTGIVAERGRKADIRIRRLRHGRFEVQDKTSKHVVGDGDPVVVIDSVGGRHSLTLRAFSTNAASRVATRR
jgi:hypothetical protein